MNALLPDTRPFPTDPVKNDLLMYAGQMAQNPNNAQGKLAAEQLRNQIATMLFERHILGLSVAMSMAANPAVYQQLWLSLNEVLTSQSEDETQWIALPVVLVAGSKQAMTLTNATPVAALQAFFAQYPQFAALQDATWLPHLVDGSELAAIKSDKWFAAKESAAAAASLAEILPAANLHFTAGQEVVVVYALAYGSHALKQVLGLALQDAAMPLMQLWTEHFHGNGATVFANPMQPMTPMMALQDASALRTRMALDVFAANAIRAIRLQSPRAGVVVASQAGGKILFGFNATDAVMSLAPQVFTWTLASNDDMDLIMANFIDLMVECQVEHIRVLHEALPEGTELPGYAKAVDMLSSNPLFPQTH
ncbi:conjugal transfer protein [Vitreoscilla massiliensis]|uniref:Conjugal transfer protein n=1 Tax=Vitreoscilla massiliensis TaxID=1689272 RepID=A0ABY4DYC6_9NEIS|nr:hypothetical protein [Vitreoscilla massiliensis]UOO88524.1 conjugal transfer protein [Vitreoscilla massiliensis]